MPQFYLRPFANETELAMEAIVAITILVLLAATAARFGYDSRDGMRTKDYDLSAAGMTWTRHDETSPPLGAEDRYSPPVIAGVDIQLVGPSQPIEATATST